MRLVRVKNDDEWVGAMNNDSHNSQDTHDVTLDESPNVTAIKALTPHQTLETVRRLRNFLDEAHALSFTLYCSFENVSKGSEREAQKARHTVELAVARVASLLTEIEMTPHYQKIKRKAGEEL